MIEYVFNKFVCFGEDGLARISDLIYGRPKGVVEIVEAVIDGPPENYIQRVVDNTSSLWPYQSPEPQFQDGRVLVEEIPDLARRMTFRLPTYGELHSVIFDVDVQLYVWRSKFLAWMTSLTTRTPKLPLPSAKHLGALVLTGALVGLGYHLVRSCAYSHSQRWLHGTAVVEGHRVPARQALEDQIEARLDGDSGLVDNIKLLVKTRLVEWGIAERQRLASAHNYGSSLFDQQRRVRAIFENVAFGEDFIFGCLSTLGDFRTLSRGELYIQLNRHLQGFIKARLDTPAPLTIEEIGNLRAATDFVCGDHLQIQVSR